VENINENVIYGGNALEQGIIFSSRVGTKFGVKIGTVEHYGVAIRATADEDIQILTKKIQPIDKFGSYPILKKIYKFFSIPSGSSNFLKAILAMLRENKGVLNDDLHVDIIGNNLKKRFNKYIIICLLACIFLGVIPALLISQLPVASLLMTGILEASLVPILILVLLFGGFKVLTKHRNIPKYHGAEHMAINCLRAKKPLTLENVKKSSRIGVCCGTCYVSMLILMYILSCVFVFYFVQIDNTFTRATLRILILPIVYLIITNIFRLTVYSKSKVIQLFLNVWCMPALWLQRVFMTAEPNDEHISVAIAGLSSLLKINNDNGIKFS